MSTPCACLTWFTLQRNLLKCPLSNIYLPLLPSDFLISMMILSPTFMAISSYFLILILNVGESVRGPPPPMALEIFDMAFGKFFIMFSGEVNGIMFAPKGLYFLYLYLFIFKAATSKINLREPKGFCCFCGCLTNCLVFSINYTMLRRVESASPSRQYEVYLR
jgi:hypothetical protein